MKTKIFLLTLLSIATSIGMTNAQVRRHVSKCNTGNQKPTNITYKVNGVSSTDSTTLSTAIPGTEVQVMFVTKSPAGAAATATVFSLVSIKGSGPVYDPATASQDTVYEYENDYITTAGDTHTLTVTVPTSCYFQIDFVKGCVINPPKSTTSYVKQGRLIASGGGGEGCGTIGAFPVKLTSFNANKISHSEVVLNWSTAQESNSQYIAVEKSTDINNWTEVCRVPSNSPDGNSNTTQKYSCTDKNADANGQNLVYYRPKQVDFNGTYEYFNTIKLRLEDAAYATSVDNVYPNPMQDNRIHIAYNSAENGIFNLRVVDMQGKTLLSQAYAATPGHQVMDLTLPETTLKSGFYILEVQNDNVIFRQKIYKQ